jgi:sec-independent protein translocase protein TatC
MRQKDDKDLFQESTMTFGEHLEELRSCLFKSLAGLMIGFIVGLFLGGHVVAFIQTPLNKALKAYYRVQASEDLRDRLDELRDAGYPLPDDPKQIELFLAQVEKRNLVLDEVYINPGQLLGQLKKTDPKRFGNLPDVKTDSKELFDPDALMRIFTWRKGDESQVKAKSLNVQEPFVVYIKASLLVGVLLSSPWIFFQIWSFVAAGLYGHERHFVHAFLPFSLLLFLAGASLAFFFVFEPVLKFLFSFNQWLGIDPDPRISEWLGFVMMLPLGFGVSFQLPLVMLFLERIGIFDVKIYVSKWRIAILVIFILAMLLTPADPTSMLLMAVPLTFLYACGILLCKWLPRKSSPVDAID